MQTNSVKRKLQVSNGHYLDVDQIARLIHALVNTDEQKKATMTALEEESGLPFRQVRNRVSIARAMGLFKERKLELTTFGNLVAQYDPFFEAKGTLEFAHYLAASNYKNLIWYEVFNTLLQREQALDAAGWLKYFREFLAGSYSQNSLKEHLGKEIRFVVQAYIDNVFSKISVVAIDQHNLLQKRRYLHPTPLIFGAILYHYGEKVGTELLQVEELLDMPGSPTTIFFMDRNVFDGTIELLHDKGYLRYEGTHDLNQIRLKEEYTTNSFLEAFFENREPKTQ